MRFLPSCLAVCLAVLLTACASDAPCESRFSTSPQFRNCGFRNPDNPDAKPSTATWKLWTRFLLGTKKGTVPIDPIPVQPLTEAQLDALDPQAVHIVRLGHSSHLLKLRGKFWLIDPVFGERVSPFSFAGPKRFHAPPLSLQQLPAIEGLILSHDHYDHLDEPTIRFLAQRVQRYFVPLGVGQRLLKMGVPADRIVELDWWQSATFNDVQLTAAPAQHFSGRWVNDRDSTLWASWVVRSGSQSIFYSGDSGYSPAFKQIGERLGGFDLVLIENGAYDDNWPSVHMSPEESVRAFEDVRGRVMFPVHNSTFDLAFHTWRDPLDRIANLAEAKKIELATPVIGEVLTMGQPRKNVRWWADLK